MNKQDKINETRLTVFKRDGWRCKRCGRRLAMEGITPQLAHRIPQRKYNIKKYGKEVIHHPMNLVAVCSLNHNAYFDLGVKSAEIEQLANKIRKVLDKDNEI